MVVPASTRAQLSQNCAMEGLSSASRDNSCITTVRRPPSRVRFPGDRLPPSQGRLLPFAPSRQSITCRARALVSCGVLWWLTPFQYTTGNGACIGDALRVMHHAKNLAPPTASCSHKFAYRSRDDKKPGLLRHTGASPGYIHNRTSCNWNCERGQHPSSGHILRKGSAHLLLAFMHP